MGPSTIPSETSALLNDAQANNLERAMSNQSRNSRYDSISSQESGFRGVDPDYETTYKAESVLLAKYSLPLMFTYLLQYSYSLVTVFVAGRLGTVELGAASLASMTANITGLCVYEGLATALDTLTSQAYGGGRKKLVGLHVQRMMVMMLAATIPIGIVWICSPWIIERLVPEKETARMAGQFLRIYLIGAPGFGLFEAGKRFTQAQGHFIGSLIPMLICAPLNILWNWLFVFKLNLGFTGAALAVAVSNTLQPIIFLLYINTFARHTLECWPGFSFKQSIRNWPQMLKLGIPGISMVLSEWLAFDILTFASSYIDSEALAAQSVLMTVAVTMYHIPMPVSVAASTRFGNLVGHGALKAARKTVFLYYMVFLGIGLFDIIVITSLRHVVAWAFSDDAAVRKLVVATIPIVAAAQMFDALASIANGLLRGIGRQKVGGWANLAVYYVWAVPVALFLTFGPPDMDLIGLWVGPLSGLGLVSIVVTLYLYKSDWHKAVEEARSREED